MVSYSVKSIRVVRGTYRHIALTHCSLPALKHQRNLLHLPCVTHGSPHGQLQTTLTACAVEVKSLRRPDLPPFSHEALWQHLDLSKTERQKEVPIIVPAVLGCGEHPCRHTGTPRPTAVGQQGRRFHHSTQAQALTPRCSAAFDSL